MTYKELLEVTAEKKRKALADLDAALKGPTGFLVKAEIERDPGTAAWAFLAREFCETLAEHVGEFIDQSGGLDTPEACEVGEIYMAYEDGDENLYDYLPVEARLFDQEG